MSRLAIIQQPPVLMDREKTVRAAVTMVDQAVAGGAEAVLFPEAFIPGYPAWVWRLRPGPDIFTLQVNTRPLRPVRFD